MYQNERRPLYATFCHHGFMVSWFHNGGKATTRSCVEPVELLESRQDDLFARLLYLAADNELVQYAVGFVEAKHEIELAHILKVMVQDLHEQVDALQDEQFVITEINPKHKEQTGVSPRDKLVRFVLDERRTRRVPRRALPVNVLLNVRLFWVREGVIPLCSFGRLFVRSFPGS